MVSLARVAVLVALMPMAVQFRVLVAPLVWPVTVSVAVLLAQPAELVAILNRFAVGSFVLAIRTATMVAVAEPAADRADLTAELVVPVAMAPMAAVSPVPMEERMARVDWFLPLMEQQPVMISPGAPVEPVVEAAAVAGQPEPMVAQEAMAAA